MKNISENKKKLIDTECWIFDLDNTLYPASCNLFAQVDKKMTVYIAEFLRVNLDQASKIRKSYYRDYGTTMSGMMTLHDMEPSEFLEYVHDIDLRGVPSNPELDKALSKLSGRKIIYTNGTTSHAERVLKQLSIYHHFEETFDIISANYIPKPFPKPYELLIESYQINPSKTVMVEDLIRNLIPAATLGMATVWVKSDQQFNLDLSNLSKIHHVVDDLTGWLSALTSS